MLRQLKINSLTDKHCIKLYNGLSPSIKYVVEYDRERNKHCISLYRFISKVENLLNISRC